jgi:signal transduction histidine kinase
VSDPVSKAAILVIDDEAGLCDMLRYGLPKRGYRVVTASNGEEGLARAREQVFDLAVCDIMMPGMNGIAVLTQLREITPQTEVLMATGQATVETAIESIKKGAFDYITKPYSLPQLCLVLEKALEWRALRARVDHLEELNRLKDEFMSTISHELRTPITVIMGYATLLRDKIYGALSSEQENGLRTIEGKARTLLQIINNIIDYANLSAKREAVRSEVLSVTEIARNAVEPFTALAAAKPLRLTVDIAANLYAETDRAKLKQILIHLLDNAIKFTPKGAITLHVAAEEPDHFRISVADTGIGIAPEHIPLIFQEFRQVDQSSTRRYGGTGLGLAVFKKFVDLLGGQIAVESVPGRGSTFSVLLPGRCPAPVALAAPSVVQPPPLAASPTLLLVVDDDPAFVRMFQSLLSKEGYPAETACSGSEALERMASKRPDVMLLDLIMPEVTGFEVLEAMERDPALRDIRVVIMTSKDLTEAERTFLSTRAELVIQKGTKDLQEILHLLHLHLDGHAA